MWTSFRVPPPQRRARLYRAIVEKGLASAVSGQLVPTAYPFLYTISATATDGTPLAAVEAALVEELDRVRREGVTLDELERARGQLHARLVFDNDSITNIAHQLGYFETVAGVAAFTELGARLDAVTMEQVAGVARSLLTEANRTVGWFDPLPIGGGEANAAA
jgi:zinc protease